MISFYPGPSRVYDRIPRYVQDAYETGILSLNHRSPEFETISKTTVALLKQKIGIPANYTVVFTTSATECWEIISQSLVKEQSIHIINGAFGAKWFDYARRLHPQSYSIGFEKEALPEPSKMYFNTGEVICITQNETSNGTQVPASFIDAVRVNNPAHLIAVDATSSMAGIRLDFKTADIWFASVQKCFGLPAGLGLMALSPKAMAEMTSVNEGRHYNSLTFMTEMMSRWQTSCTPNVLGIYLLMRSLKDRPAIAEIHKEVKARSKAWHTFLKKSTGLDSLVKKSDVQSYTVIAVKAEPDLIEKIKKEAKAKGFLLGEGYGTYKRETFRIANFPALHKKEINALMKFLSAY